MRPLDSLLCRTAKATFEELAFLVAGCAPLADTSFAPAADPVAVRFHGATAGRLELRVAQAVLPVIASNMLGNDEPPAADLQQDALGELANVICGNILPALAGPRAVYRLDPPTPHTATGGEPAAAVRLELEDGWAEVRLVLTATPPE